MESVNIIAPAFPRYLKHQLWAASPHTVSSCNLRSIDAEDERVISRRIGSRTAHGDARVRSLPCPFRKPMDMGAMFDSSREKGENHPSGKLHLHYLSAPKHGPGTAPSFSFWLPHCWHASATSRRSQHQFVWALISYPKMLPYVPQVGQLMCGLRLLATHPTTAADHVRQD